MPGLKRLAGLLQGHHDGALETQVGLEVLRDLPDQALERELADEQLGGLLVPGGEHSVESGTQIQEYNNS